MSGLEPVAGLGAVAVALIAFLGGWRMNRGSVTTSTADRLWAEAGAIRADLAREVATLLAAIDEREKEISSLRLEIMQKEEELSSVRRENYRLGNRVTELEAQIVQIKEAAS